MVWASAAPAARPARPAMAHAVTDAHLMGVSGYEPLTARYGGTCRAGAGRPRNREVSRLKDFLHLVQLAAPEPFHLRGLSGGLQFGVLDGDLRLPGAFHQEADVQVGGRFAG